MGRTGQPPRNSGAFARSSERLRVSAGLADAARAELGAAPCACRFYAVHNHMEAAW